jgi:putative hemolysin
MARPLAEFLLAPLAAIVLVATAAGSLASAATVGGVGIANPASVACVKRGGRLEIRTAPDGGQIGYCHLRNGRVCEEWALFRDRRCVSPPKGPKPDRPMR